MSLTAKAAEEARAQYIRDEMAKTKTVPLVAGHDDMCKALERRMKKLLKKKGWPSAWPKYKRMANNGAVQDADRVLRRTKGKKKLDTKSTDRLRAEWEERMQAAQAAKDTFMIQTLNGAKPDDIYFENPRYGCFNLVIPEGSVKDGFDEPVRNADAEQRMYMPLDKDLLYTSAMFSEACGDELSWMVKPPKYWCDPDTESHFWGPEGYTSKLVSDMVLGK